MFQSHVAFLFPRFLFCMYSMFLDIMFQLHVPILFLCVLFGVYCAFIGFQCFYVSRFHPFHKSIHSIILPMFLEFVHFLVFLHVSQYH